MEKNNKETLAIFAAEIEELKTRLASLEARFEELSSSLPEEEEEEVVAVPEEADLPEAPEVPEVEEVDGDTGVVDIDIVDLPEDIPVELPGDPVYDAVAPLESAPEEAAPVEEVSQAPDPETAPETAPEAAPEAAEEDDLPEDKPSAGPELMAPSGSYPWQTAKPGLPVKNLRSGISLFDRALFINTLFKEDYVLYDKSISDLNAVSTFPEAVDYVLRHFPDWNLSSDVVYSFMMALRKKLG